MCKRQDDQTGTADLKKCASKIHFRTVACDIHHADKYWISSKGNLSNSVYNVPRKISICLPMRSSNIYWDMGPVQMEIVV